MYIWSYRKGSHARRYRVQHAQLHAGRFRAILNGAAFGIFAFVGIGIWSVAIAGENTDEQFENGVTIALLYAEYCNEPDIDRDLYWYQNMQKVYGLIDLRRELIE